MLGLILCESLRGFIILARLKISAYLVVVLLTVSIAARAVGSLQPINPALQEFVEGCEGKRFPCWYGIVPGITTFEEADEILNLESVNGLRSSANYTMGFFKSTSPLVCHGSIYVRDNVVSSIYLPICEKVSILAGEVIALFGITPNQIAINFGGPPELVFGDGSLFYLKFSLYDRVGEIIISYPNAPALKWHGFVPLWRYCQLEPEHSGC